MRCGSAIIVEQVMPDYDEEWLVLLPKTWEKHLQYLRLALRTQSTHQSAEGAQGVAESVRRAPCGWLSGWTCAWPMLSQATCALKYTCITLLQPVSGAP